MAMSKPRVIRSRYNITARRRIVRTNDPGWCLWCGNRLRKARGAFAEKEYGDYADNAFWRGRGS